MAGAVGLQVLIGFDNAYPSLLGFVPAVIAGAVTVVFVRHRRTVAALRLMAAVALPALLLLALWWFVFVFRHGFTSMYQEGPQNEGTRYYPGGRPAPGTLLVVDALG